jgi:hypothetical protein
MRPIDNGGTAAPLTRLPDHACANAAPAPAETTDGHPLGEHAPAILAAEHWSLLAARSLVWAEASSRATVFLTVLSASIVALALVANATGFGSQTTNLARVLLPVVLLLGLATHVRLVRINVENYQLELAMNRLRHAYLRIEPGLEPYLSTGHHDDEPGVMTSYLRDQQSRPRWSVYFLTNTPTVVATVVAALAAAVAVLILQAAGTPRVATVAGGTVAFGFAWVGLFLLQYRSIGRVRSRTPRFPTPASQLRQSTDRHRSGHPGPCPSSNPAVASSGVWAAPSE